MVTDAERFHPAALEDWRDWLATNHTRREGVWVVGWRARSGRTTCAIERAKATGMWTVFDSVEALEEPPGLAAALDAEPAVRGAWEASPPSVRKQTLGWIVLARRPETRAPASTPSSRG